MEGREPIQNMTRNIKENVTDVITQKEESSMLQRARGRLRDKELIPTVSTVHK